MTMYRRTVATCVALSVGLLAGFPPARAQDGQPDLDKAMDLRLRVKTLAELREVATLAEQAIEKGLTADDEQFAKQLLTGALYEYASRLCQPILVAPRMNPQLRELRQKVLPDLQRIIQIDGKFGQAHLLIAELQTREGGDADEARKAVDQAIQHLRQDPRTLAEALILRARLQTSPEQRLADYNQALELDPENPQARQARAIHHLERGETDEAIADFQNLIGGDGDNLMARIALTEVLINAGRLDEAQQQIDAVIEQQPLAVALALRARLWIQRGDLERGRKDLDAALELEPGNPALLLLRSRFYHAEGRNALALRDVDQIMRIRPDLPEILELRASILAALGNFDEAVREISKLLAEDPENVLIKLQLGIYLNAAGQSRKAIEVFSDVLRTEPQHGLARRGRADAYLSVGEHEPAIADYEVALQVAPDESGILNNFAWVLATSPDDRLRDGKRAIVLAEKACRLTEYQEAHILSTLAAAYAETGDFDTARKWAQQAVDLGDESVREQLQAELESYRRNEPWRERQQEEEQQQEHEPPPEPEPEPEQEPEQEPRERQPDTPTSEP
jgi:FimV-like protein